MNENDMKARFEALAPWHVNGTLDPMERRWVEDYVREHPDAAAELRWYESLQTKIRANIPETSPDLGWDKLQQRIRLERRQATKSWSEQLSELWSSLRFGQTLSLRPAFAYAAVALVVVQAGVIGTMVLEQSRQQAEFEEWRSLQTPVVSGPVLRVSFRPEASERDIRMLLLNVSGTIVGGPGQLGNYIIYVPGNRIDAAADALAKDEHVDTVDIMARVPGKE